MMFLIHWIKKIMLLSPSFLISSGWKFCGTENSSFSPGTGYDLTFEADWLRSFEASLFNFPQQVNGCLINFEGLEIESSKSHFNNPPPEIACHLILINISLFSICSSKWNWILSDMGNFL
jgi:hypothetical protein